jgi:hypothetical protein
MNEALFFGGRRVALAGVGEPFGLGDVGDLLAYRRMWEPFIEAHLNLWRDLNEVLEGAPTASQCPSGIFSSGDVQTTNPSTRSFCAALSLSRARVSDTPEGILPQWNAWKNKSSSEILAGARTMLEWHQEVVLRVGNTYKNDLINIRETWGLSPVTLPDLPPFNTQQEIIARIEGAYITAKGAVQLIGYGIGQTLRLVSNATEAVVEGLSDTAKELPKITSRIGIAAVIAAAVVGGALIIYYAPRKHHEPIKT